MRTSGILTLVALGVTVLLQGGVCPSCWLGSCPHTPSAEPAAAAPTAPGCCHTESERETTEGASGPCSHSNDDQQSKCCIQSIADVLVLPVSLPVEGKALFAGVVSPALPLALTATAPKPALDYHPPPLHVSIPTTVLRS